MYRQPYSYGHQPAMYSSGMYPVNQSIMNPGYPSRSMPSYMPLEGGGGVPLPTHAGQAITWYEVEVFRDPHPIPMMTREPAGQGYGRMPYDPMHSRMGRPNEQPNYQKFRTKPIVTDVTNEYYDHRQLPSRGDQYLERLPKSDRYYDRINSWDQYIDNGFITSRPRSVPPFMY